MLYSLDEIIIYSLTPVFLFIGVYLSIKIKFEYKNFQKRKLCSSILCLAHHELYVGLVCYCAWYNTWPFFNLNANLFLHIIISIVGIFLVIIGIFFYISYLAGIKSVLIAIGRNPNELIADGIFKVSRNPQSLSRIIGLIGLALWGRSFFSLFLALSWISMNHFNVLIEENHLENLFGVSYLHYCSSTPRYCGVFKNTQNKKFYINIEKLKQEDIFDIE
jgi:protein-S-isoprenylcysteine O-methyltransferase Ste14